MNFKIIINFGRWIEDWEEEGWREEVYNYKLSRLLGTPMDESNLLLSKVEFYLQANLKEKHYGSSKPRLCRVFTNALSVA